MHYRSQFIGKFIPELIIDDKFIVDPKVVTAFNDTPIAQTLEYLKITGLEVALFVNFKEAHLTWKRIANEYRRNRTADFADVTDEESWF